MAVGKKYQIAKLLIVENYYIRGSKISFVPYKYTYKWQHSKELETEQACWFQ